MPAARAAEAATMYGSRWENAEDDACDRADHIECLACLHTQGQLATKTALVCFVRDREGAGTDTVALRCAQFGKGGRSQAALPRDPGPRPNGKRSLERLLVAYSGSLAMTASISFLVNTRKVRLAGRGLNMTQHAPPPVSRSLASRSGSLAGSGCTRVSTAGFGCSTETSTPTKARPTTPIPIPTCTTPAMDGCGWRLLGSGAGVRILTFSPAVRWALAGTLACTGPGMVGADTAAAVTADTAIGGGYGGSYRGNAGGSSRGGFSGHGGLAVATAEAMVAALADKDLQELVGCRRVAGLQHGRGGLPVSDPLRSGPVRRVTRVPLMSLLLRGQPDHLAGDHEDALPSMVHRPRASP